MKMFQYVLGQKLKASKREFRIWKGGQSDPNNVLWKRVWLSSEEAAWDTHSPFRSAVVCIPAAFPILAPCQCTP